MANGKHTPTPWDCSDSENYSAIFGKGFQKPMATCDSYSKGFGPCKEERKANAAHIVKCVNMHDELVEALKWACAFTENEGHYEKWQTTLKKAGAL